MSRYSEQFKRDAVALYKNNKENSLSSVSALFRINRASLHSWTKLYAPSNTLVRKPSMIKPIPLFTVVEIFAYSLRHNL